MVQLNLCGGGKTGEPREERTFEASKVWCRKKSFRMVGWPGLFDGAGGGCGGVVVAGVFAIEFW